MAKEDLTQDELHALLVLAERSVDLSMPNGTPAQQTKFLSIWYASFPLLYFLFSSLLNCLLTLRRLEIATKYGVNEAVVVSSL